MKKLLLSFLLFSGFYLKAQPVADFTVNPGCETDVFHFVDASTSFHEITAWHWDFGDFNVAETQNADHVYPACGTYLALLVVSDSTGVIDSVYHDVTVYCSPVADFSMSASSGCDSVCVDFTNLSSVVAGSITGCEWSLSDGIDLISCDLYHCYYMPGNYDVSLTVTTDQGCFSTYTAENAVSVYGYPQAGFTFQTQDMETVSFTDTSSGATSWYWDFGDMIEMDNDTSTLQNPTWIYNLVMDAPIIACLTVSNEGGCSATVCQLLSAGAIEDGYSSDTEIHIYPNPSSGIMTIDIAGNYTGNAELQIMSITGAVIYSEKISSQISQIDLSGFAAGNYILRIATDQQVIDRKVTID